MDRPRRSFLKIIFPGIIFSILIGALVIPLVGTGWGVAGRAAAAAAIMGLSVAACLWAARALMRAGQDNH